MTRPSSWSSLEESLLLLNAYLDDELDAASSVDVEHRLANDPALRAEHDRLVQLRKALSFHAKSDKASDAFRSRIAEIAHQPKRLASRVAVSKSAYPPSQADWRKLGSAAAVAAVISAGATFGVLRPNLEPNEVASIVSDHQRALLASSPFDVASSDQHTVKPWFDSKLALSPEVIDLAGYGFPLAGGRVEVINGKPVPVLVYRRRAHIISVVAIPHSHRTVTTTPNLAGTKDGYSVFQWQGRDFDYTAVSDLAQDELSEFVHRWRGVSDK
ncbi:MAG: anti-sigma factor [Hyphomicrobiales bacterium]